MKARTKNEKEVERLSARLPQITEYQKRFLARHTFQRNAYRTKKAVFCVQCGAELPHDALACPHCGKLIIEDRRTSKRNDARWSSIVTTCKGWQVVRHFEITRIWRKGNPTTFHFAEIEQEWINPQGKRTIMARNKAMFGYGFNFASDMTIKKPTYWEDYVVRGYATRFCRATPLLRRNGFVTHDIGIAPSKVACAILTDNFAEMLIKSRQYAILKDHIYRGRERFLPQVRIANRNGYIVQDANMWFDYLRMIEEIGLDTHNPHYVCPADLKTAHDRALARHNRERDRINAERQREEAKQAEKLYKQLHAKYLAIYFGNADIAISVAQSVEDIRQEGEHMHHCVFACGYYKRADALIMFARDKHTGKRIETIEIDLNNFKVAQSRGVCNQLTPQHDEIVALCNANMHLLRAVA